MKLKTIAADYARKGKQGLEIDLALLALNKEFNEEAIKKLEALVPPKSCVLLPGSRMHFTKIINELALCLQSKALVTSNIENLKTVQADTLVIIKQSFRTGQTLREQIADLKDSGVKKILLLCIIANSSGRLEGFSAETGVEAKALVKTDEIEYIPG